MEEYKVSDYGEAHFYIEKKNIRRGITCTGIITMIEKNYLLFTDNDRYEYIVNKKEFTFKPVEKL